MYFYVDESGHTGSNLFDQNQKNLYYGVLSSPNNLDEHCAQHILSARERVQVDRLHANELGVNRLTQIADILMHTQQQNTLHFDFLLVRKIDYAIISFFDQVFDQGLNPAMTWSGYWTPLRYFLLAKLSTLFDLKTLKLAWATRLELDARKAHNQLEYVCNILLSRIDIIVDARSRQLIGDTLAWAAQNPGELNYSCSSEDQILTITPNIIGFQSVMHTIARKIQAPEGATSIIVDQQTQFNRSQRDLAEFYASARSIPWNTGPGLPQMDLKNIPSVPITFRSSAQSYGLELVDIYLWIFKRSFEGLGLSRELEKLIEAFGDKATIDEIGVEAIATRWATWTDNLPDPTSEQVEKGKELLNLDESRRVKPRSGGA